MALTAAMLTGCGNTGGGVPTTDLICRGDGVIIGGKVTFVKRSYDKTGLTGARQIRPVRYALVEMVLEIDGRAIGSTYTDANGNYCMELRGVPTDFPIVYPRVATKTDPNRFAIAVVDDILNPQPNLYSRTGASFNGVIRANYDRDIPVPVYAQVAANADFPLAGAYNILDVATTGAEVAIGLTGRRPSAELLVGWTPGTVFGAGTVGTYFVGDDPTQRLAGIELSGGEGGDPDAGDHDEYDDDVILHEFGHFMAYSFSKPAEAGGAHYLNDSTQDIRLAWSEGWATFFSAAVRNSPVMVNTRGGDPGHPDHDLSYSFEIDTPHSDLLSSSAIRTPLEDHGVYTTSEVAVASLLWELYDSSNESGDRFALGFQGVWDVVSRMVAAPANVSFETFATYFATQFGMPNLAQTAELRRVQLSPDAFEVYGDDLIATSLPAAVSGVVTCRTLFPEGDVDHIRITLSTPRAMTVETLNLSNGADTFVQLLDATGQVVQLSDGTRLENDNAGGTPRPFELTGCGNRRVAIPDVYFRDGLHNGSRLRSLVTTGSEVLPAGDYFAKVMSRATLPGGSPSAGKLGSYDLIVTLN
jgi:hypothetical protein